MADQKREQRPGAGHDQVHTVKSTLDESEIDKRHEYQMFPTQDQGEAAEESRKLEI